MGAFLSGWFDDGDSLLLTYWRRGASCQSILLARLIVVITLRVMKIHHAERDDYGGKWTAEFPPAGRSNHIKS
jgi:hypothetical protein